MTRKGHIVKIHLRDFMTYKTLEWKPGPNLNMIIGPNGSGKSAIVCAIIVGLAGDVTLTGRATNLASLVRRGCTSATTRIELYNDCGKNYIIERKITITCKTPGKMTNETTWKLNDRNAPKKAIQDLMKELNIKVDNMCQFLPQDSVASFVKMTTGELLENTLKAAGDNQLVDELGELTMFTTMINEKSTEFENLKKSCEENAVNARRLETEVERLKEREELIKKKKIVGQKVFFVRYTEACEKRDEAEEEILELQSRLDQAKSSANPHLTAVEFYRSEESKLVNLIRANSSDSGKITDCIDQGRKLLDERKMECQEHFKRFKDKQDQQNQRDMKLRQERQKLETQECLLNDIRDVDYDREIASTKALSEEVKAALMEKNQDKNKIEEEMRDLIRNLEELKARRETILSVRQKKINLLQSKHPQAYRVTEWLAKNQDKFKEKIYLPMLCEINVKEAKYASILEHVIPNAELMAFVCQTEDDLRLLTRVARKDLNANINVILRPDKTLAEIERVTASQRQEFSGMRFKAYMSDLVEGPEAIMRYLYGQHGIHMIPVFDEASEQHLKQLMDTCKKFYVGNKFYHISRSRYDNEKLTVSDTVRAAQILIYSLDKKQLDICNQKLEEIGQLKSQKEAERIEIMDAYKSLNIDWQKHAKRVQELTAKQKEKKRVEEQIALCQRKISELLNENIDLNAERELLQGKIKKINKNTIEDLSKLAKLYKKYSKLRQELCLNVIKYKLAKAYHKLAEKKYKMAQEDAIRFEQMIREKKSLMRGILANVEKEKQVAEEKISGFKNGKLSKVFREKFQTIPENDAESLQQLYDTLKARVNGLFVGAGNDIIEEFNRHTDQLRDKQKRISEIQHSLKTLELSRTELKSRFLPKLDGVIKVIDDHYQEFMRKLHYDGRVMLSQDTGNPDDFSKYGVSILVKYRDHEQLIPLSSTRQSGGERSVATMIYMLALQAKTTVPFRVVDEINQGMDKDNERKVFELLVRTADESSSQYFLVSPKLLHNLKYSENMMIHVIYNGPKLEYNFNELMQASSYNSEGESE